MPAFRPASRLALCLWLLAPFAARGAAGPSFAEAARDLGQGERLRVAATVEAWGPGELVLDLARFDAAAPGARLTLHGAEGASERPLPATVHLRGWVEGRAGARAAIAVHEDGELRAIVSDAGGIAHARARGDQPLRFARPSNDRAAPAFACAADGLEGPDGPVDELAPIVAAFDALGAIDAPAVASHTARVALETDHEYYQRFGNATAASEYALDLIAFASTIYEAELDTGLAVASLSLWTTSADPWTQSSSSCGFYQFGGYWNENHAGDPRTLAHFLSGKSTGGGIAWVGVLCSGAFSVSGLSCPGMATSGSYGGAYGFTGNISGSFEPDDPQPVWDIIAVAHEIGHNFGSPHTHCYAGYGGVSAHVDQCATSSSSGCYPSGAITLPGPDSVTGGSPGQGNGTIMSYCHLLSGGYANIELGFGLGHPYGVAAERVPQRMAAHVASRAGTYPSCLAPLAAGTIFTDNFESGTLARWSL